MLKNAFKEAAMRLYNFSDYPAVRYKILFHLLDKSYNDENLSLLRSAFLTSDIVEELYQQQDKYRGWGKFESKDYTVKGKLPTSQVAINWCLYIGLTIEDKDILLCANEYLEDLLNGVSNEIFSNTNERVIPWNKAKFCNMIEAINPYSPLCDWGPQIKDLWGYFGYFSTNRNYRHNRVVDCTIEILSFLKKYIDNNAE